MDRLQLVADDLTGALDSAAQLTAAMGPIRVAWRPLPPAVRRFALDAGTRDLPVGQAAATLEATLAALPRDDAALRFAKIDSLLRGHVADAIAAWFRLGAFDHCLIAPAFPHQGRVTRAGRTRVQVGAGWDESPVDLRADLEHRGLAVAPRRPGDRATPGLSLWDAESDADLDSVVTAGRALHGSVLWCGSGGLAGALAARGRAAAWDAAPLRRPILGLFGTDHPVTAAQLAECGPAVLTVPDGGPASANAVTARIDATGVALVRLDLPDGTSRREAALRIAREIGELVHRLTPPATLVVAGGETLRGICERLDVDGLDVDAQREPGVPCSRIRGGHLEGVRVVSKSGGFGDATFLRRLIGQDEPRTRGDHT